METEAEGKDDSDETMEVRVPVIRPPSQEEVDAAETVKVVLTKIGEGGEQEEFMTRSSISLEATCNQIKTLFRLKDDVESLCRRDDGSPVVLTKGDNLIAVNDDGVNRDLPFAHVIFLAVEFYNSKEAAAIIGDRKWQTLLPISDQPSDETEENMADIRPIKINMSLNSGTLTDFNKNVKAIFGRLVEVQPRMNIYWVISETFRFALQHQIDFVKFIRPKTSLAEPKLKGVNVRCEICRDRCRASEYCGVFACGKCQKFFQSVMKEKTVFSLRCSKFNDCDLSKDLSCRRCRADKCRSLGMLDSYYTSEMDHPMSRRCGVCYVTSTDDDCDFKLIRGVLLCVRCEALFDQAVQVNKKDQLGQRFLAFRNPFKCKKEENACLVTPDSTCRSCLWDKMAQLGLSNTYLVKFQGFQAFSPTGMGENLCSVCDDNDGIDLPWMGQQVCQACRSFLELSMRLDTHLSYCCPQGEYNRLCPINFVASHDSAESDDEENGATIVPVASRCKYCWFRRLEIEGLVDRWFICGGHTELWREFDNPVYSSEDENEASEEEPLEKAQKDSD